MGKTKISAFEFMFGPTLRFYKKKSKYEKLKAIKKEINKMTDYNKLKQIVNIILTNNKFITYDYKNDFEVDLLKLTPITIRLIEQIIEM